MDKKEGTQGNGKRNNYVIVHRLEHSVTDLDVTITAENVKEIGELITLCALKHFLPYRKVESLYYGLIRDLDRQDDISRTLTEGYDLAQTAICFLCEHMGKMLGDAVMGKYKKPVTIRHACYSVIGNMVYKYYQDQKNVRGEWRNDSVKVPAPFEEDTTEQSYQRVDEMIRKMRLTKKQKITLDCYLKGMGVCEISRLLSVAHSTVWRSRMILQRKYNELYGE